MTITLRQHARERLHERFPGLDVEPADEVRLAFRCGRVAPRPPYVTGMRTRWRGWELYAWTPEADRVYVLGAGCGALVVVTVLAREAA